MFTTYTMLNRRILLIASALAAVPALLWAKVCKPSCKPKYKLIADDEPTTVEPGKPAKPATPGIKKQAARRGLHSHICRACRFEFWHVEGSHYCPRCGKGPWYTINQGESLNTRKGLFR